MKVDLRNSKKVYHQKHELAGFRTLFVQRFQSPYSTFLLFRSTITLTGAVTPFVSNVYQHFPLMAASPVTCASLYPCLFRKSPQSPRATSCEIQDGSLPVSR